jgi:hypothetical protein
MKTMAWPWAAALALSPALAMAGKCRDLATPALFNRTPQHYRMMGQQYVEVRDNLYARAAALDERVAFDVGEGEEREPPVTATPHACGWIPAGATGPDAAFFEHPAGCGVAPVAGAGWRTVTELNPVSIELLPGQTRVRAIFLNAHGQRVVPVGHAVTYDMQFRRRRQGRIVLRESMQRDGVFTFELPPEQKPAACRLFLFMHFGNGRGRVTLSIGDWLHSC